MNALKPCRYLRQKTCSVTSETCLYWANEPLQRKCEEMVLKTIERYRGAPQDLPECSREACAITGSSCCFSGSPVLTENCHRRVERVWEMCRTDIPADAGEGRRRTPGGHRH